MKTLTIEKIKDNVTYKEVLDDSFGGVIYDIDNQGKYDQKNVDWLIETWDSMTENEQNFAGGIMRGAIGFLKGE